MARPNVRGLVAGFISLLTLLLVAGAIGAGVGPLELLILAAIALVVGALVARVSRGSSSEPFGG